MSAKNLLLAAAGAGEEINPNAWDVTKAFYKTYDASFSLANFDLVRDFITTDNGRIDASDNSPYQTYIRENGIDVYVVGDQSDKIYRFQLSEAFNIDTMGISAIADATLPTAGIEPRGLFFKPDGTKFYVSFDNSTGATTVGEYALSSAWDITTRSYTATWTASDTNLRGRTIYISDDGVYLYMQNANTDTLEQYSMSTPWDISTISYVQGFYYGGTQSDAFSFTFNPTGTRLFIAMGTSTSTHYQYVLSTAWDVSTTSYSGVSFSFSTAEEAVAIQWSPDGALYYLTTRNTSNGTRIMRQYAVHYGPETAALTGVFAKPDGTKFYTTDTSDDVISYNLSTPWDLTTASLSYTLDISAQETTINDLHFSPDGTRLYVVGATGTTVVDSVTEFTLSVAWDISTASFVQQISVAAQESNPQALFFKPDGTKMYVMGTIGDDVNEYNLSTPWDISTISYVQNFSISSQGEGAPQGLFFKSDGLKMYAVGDSNFTVFEYNLSSAWDVSSASYSQFFSMKNYIKDANGLYWRPNGSDFFIAEQARRRILQFTISPD